MFFNIRKVIAVEDMMIGVTQHIIAVEIAEDRIFNDNFSPKIEEKYEEIFNEVKEITERILATNY